MTDNRNAALRNEARDAASMILAAVAGDDDGMVDAVILEAARRGDVREVARLLRWTVTAAAEAIKAECVAATERGDDQTESVRYLVALQG